MGGVPENAEIDRLPKLALHLIAIFHGTQGSKLQAEISALTVRVFPFSSPHYVVLLGFSWPWQVCFWLENCCAVGVVVTKTKL